MNILKKSYAETLLRFAAHSHRYGNAIPKNSRTTPAHCSGVTASERIITEQIIPAGSSDELKIVAAPVDIFGILLCNIHLPARKGGCGSSSDYPEFLHSLLCPALPHLHLYTSILHLRSACRRALEVWNPDWYSRLRYPVVLLRDWNAEDINRGGDNLKFVGASGRYYLLGDNPLRSGNSAAVDRRCPAVLWNRVPVSVGVGGKPEKSLRITFFQDIG